MGRGSNERMDSVQMAVRRFERDAFERIARLYEDGYFWDGDANVLRSILIFRKLVRDWDSMWRDLDLDEPETADEAPASVEGSQNEIPVEVLALSTSSPSRGPCVYDDEPCRRECAWRRPRPGPRLAV
jgi:hypothetical protein